MAERCSSSAAASARTPTSSSRASTVRCPVVAATLRNDAGIIGAAIVAAEGLTDAADDRSTTCRPASLRPDPGS